MQTFVWNKEFTLGSYFVGKLTEILFESQLAIPIKEKVVILSEFHLMLGI